MSAPRPNRRTADQGLTIVEVIIAMVILVAVLSSIMIGMASAGRHRKKRIEYTNAQSLVRNEIERMQYQAAANIDSIPDTTYSATRSNREYTVTRTSIAPPGEFGYVIDRSSENPFLQEIEVTVHIQGRQTPLVSIRTIQGFGR